MISRRSTTEVPYSAAQMFDLVADIEAYPKFLPWCVALRVVERDLPPSLEAGEGMILADMIVAYKVFREQFRSRVTLDGAGKVIDAHYTDGPFEILRTQWRFDDRDDNGSNIDFLIDFKFRNALLHSTAKMVFERAFARMTEAFVVRADELYGATREQTS